MLPEDGREVEVELTGGTANRGRVVRVGGTVRRPQRPTSPSVHALLRHLEHSGFDGAPRYLGDDARGREVLSYVAGDVPVQPTPAWARTDSALVSVATLLRRYHEAVADFDPSPHRWATSVPDGYRGTLVSHNDPNLDNVVFRDGVAVALIDFDLASPGRVEWDLAAAARLWVPLEDPRDSSTVSAERIPERLRLFADAYGLVGEQRRDMVLAVPTSHEWGYDIVREGAREGNDAYADYWERAQERFVRAQTWFERNIEVLLDAVSED